MAAARRAVRARSPAPELKRPSWRQPPEQRRAELGDVAFERCHAGRELVDGRRRRGSRVRSRRHTKRPTVLPGGGRVFGVGIAEQLEVALLLVAGSPVEPADEASIDQIARASP